MSLTVEHSHPMPAKRYALEGDMAELRKILPTMNVGDSFIWQKDNRHPYLAAKQVGIIITTRKIPQGGVRIWRKA